MRGICRRYVCAGTVFVLMSTALMAALPTNVSAAPGGSVDIQYSSYYQGQTMTIELDGWGGVTYDNLWKFYLRDSSNAIVMYKSYASMETSFSATETYTPTASDKTGTWKASLYYYNIQTRKTTFLDSDTTTVLGVYKWALIVDGGTIGGNQQEDFDQQTREAYTVLKGEGYFETSICLLTPYATFDADADGLSEQTKVATVSNVQWAVESWLGEMDSDDSVFIYFVNHGNTDIMGVSNGYVYSTSVATWLAGVVYSRLAFVIEACMSGSWEDNIAAANRIFISSADDAESAWPDPGTHWPAFSHAFFQELADGYSIEESFQTAYNHVVTVIGSQHPQMNDQVPGSYYP